MAAPGMATGHMQTMVKRIWQLEQRLDEQAELMGIREEEHEARFQQMERQKESEIASLQQDLAEMEQRTRQLEGSLKERDDQIAYLLHRCSFLDEAASYAPLLDQLSQCLKGSLNVSPPKTQAETNFKSIPVMYGNNGTVMTNGYYH